MPSSVCAAGSVDFLMSDGEDESSFLSLPSAPFSQRHSLTAELSDASSQKLLIQVKKRQKPDSEGTVCARWPLTRLI